MEWFFALWYDVICGIGFIRESVSSANDVYPVQQGRISNTALLNQCCLDSTVRKSYVYCKIQGNRNRTMDRSYRFNIIRESAA